MKKILRSSILSLSLLTCMLQVVYSCQDGDNNGNPVTLSVYLSGVIKGNLGYIARQFDVSIAETELKASKVFPDPELSVAYGNNEDRKLQMGQSVEAGLSYPLNLGNKRKAGIELASSQHELSMLILDAYFQNLRADAALAYFASLRDLQTHQLQVDIYEQLSKLASADSIRLEKGETTGLDALQSSLAARAQQTEVFQSQADMQNSLINLLLLGGKRPSDTLCIPLDSFPNHQREFNLKLLISNAVTNRSDLLVAIKNREVSEKTLNLIRANRSLEVSLETGYSYNSVANNEIAPAPAYKSVSAGITVPLKFSNVNKGVLQAADLAVRQSEVIYEETELQITSEVIQAYNNFIAQDSKVEHYNSGLVRDAGKILQGRIYSYRHGESGLIDVLNAQRTYIELQLNHLKALFDYTAALIWLERAAGIWDLTQ